MANNIDRADYNRWYTMPDNYIYISHLGDNGEYWQLPNFPDSIQDTMSVDFASQTVLSRSAPVYTYSSSGPRSMQISLDFHRDLMDSVNIGNSNVTLRDGEDYLDTLIKKLQAIAVPKYNLDNKLVEPPLVALRICKEVFIKGVVTGAVSTTYIKPILNNGKYAIVKVAFNIYETDPFSSTAIEKNGSFRGLTRGLKKGFHLENEPSSY